MHDLYNEKINEKIYWMNESEYDRVDEGYDSSKYDFKWWVVVWKLISSKHFRWQSEIRGTDSCDAFLFTCNYFNDVFKVKK